MPAAVAAGEGFPPSVRLRSRAEYMAVQRSGDKQHLQYFLVLSRFVDARRPARIGITVTKKIGNAVERNRIKRRVREGFRRIQDRFAPGLEMVWIAKRQAKGVAFAQVVADFDRLLRRRPELSAAAAGGTGPGGAR